MAAERTDPRRNRINPRVIKQKMSKWTGGEVLGQVTPLASDPQQVEDGIDDVAQVGLAWSSTGVDGKVALDQRPLGIGDIAGVR